MIKIKFCHIYIITKQMNFNANIDVAAASINPIPRTWILGVIILISKTEIFGTGITLQKEDI